MKNLRFTTGYWLSSALAWSCIVFNTLSAGGPGDALRFTAGSFVSVTHDAALNAYPFTVTAWFRATQPGQAGLITKAPPAGIGWQVFLNNGDLFVAYEAGGGSVGTAADPLSAMGGIADGTWHHVAFAVDANGGRLYVDGVQRDSRSWTGTPGATTAPQEMVFGGHSGGGNLFDGWLDEVTVWNVALSQAQVQSNMGRILDGNESGLVAYYRCAAGGVTVNDSAPAAGSNDGNINGSVGFLPSGVHPFMPYVETLAATSSTLNGQVNPFGTNTTAWFEWGTTTNYGNTTASQGFGALVANLNFSQSVTTPFGTFHCRAVASNSFGVVFGADQSFSVPLVTTRCFDFDNGQLPTNTALYGNATIGAFLVRLTDSVQNQTGSFIVEDFNYGANVTAIEVQFGLRIGGPFCHADGVSFVWAKDLPSQAFGEERNGGVATNNFDNLVISNGLVVSFDTWQNDPVTDPAPALDLLYGGTFTNRIPTFINLDDGSYPFPNFYPVRIKVSANGLLDVYYNYAPIVTNLPLPGFTGLAGARFGWGARTGGCYDNHWVDAICVTTETLCPTPTIRIAPSGTNVAVTFIGLLQTAPSLTGPWSTISNAPNPYVISPTGDKFFRASSMCTAP